MNLPALINTQTLKDNLGNPELLIIDLSSAESYAQGHIEGAVHISPSKINCGIKPATGKLPPLADLQSLFESIGLTNDKHVVVYDDAGGSWAGRMIWTLELIGHSSASLLDGGIAAWRSAGLPTLQKTSPASQETAALQSSNLSLSLSLNTELIADMGEILQNLDNPDYAIWDVRTPEEYNGTKVLALRGGHIPGAINLEWNSLTDASNNTCIRPLEDIQAELNAAGLTQDKTIITHCQTHRRSGLTWFVANKLLGYKAIKAYPGSWSEWGSHSETPIEK